MSFEQFFAKNFQKIDSKLIFFDFKFFFAHDFDTFTQAVSCVVKITRIFKSRIENTCKVFHRIFHRLRKKFSTIL